MIKNMWRIICRVFRWFKEFEPPDRALGPCRFTEEDPDAMTDDRVREIGGQIQRSESEDRVRPPCFACATDVM